MSADVGSLLGRFEIVRPLGEGAYGLVYEATDSERGTTVALKVLNAKDPAALYRFKQEFRALADVVHPNLVALHELAADRDTWFLTMELVRGVDFLSWVRPGGALDPTRLRSGLRQLADGLDALHGAGRLHRDVKPGHVMVTGRGTVKLLDFGLVADLGDEGAHETREVYGTPAYMPPEQARGDAVTPAADWYSVGVMLYEALTTRLPFDGAPLDILMRKQKEAPPPPSAWGETVPDDLEELCVRLLEPEVDRRARVDDVKRVARGSETRARRAHKPAAAAEELVGRDTHLAELHAAFDATDSAQPSLTHVVGQSGSGKSALLKRFMVELEERRPDAIVLSGRCYESDGAPYKALDTVVDSLSRHLSALPAEEAALVLPRDVQTLARLFPVLRQVEVVRKVQGRGARVKDESELRRRAFRALRELFARLCEQRPVLVCIDDLQWGDLDSVLLLEELMRPPDAPQLCVVASYRRDDDDKNAVLRRLKEAAGRLEATVRTRRVEVADLSDDEAETLARSLVGAGGDALSERIASESRGNPLFLIELVEHVARSDAPSAEHVDLEAAILSRAAGLEPGAQRLLEVVALCGRPVDRVVAMECAGVDDESAVAALTTQRLLKQRGTGLDDSLETYHDRVRHIVAEALDEDRRQKVHGRLAAALDAAGAHDPEAVADHYARAGEDDRAFELAQVAAERAVVSLAFARAARVLRFALELRPDAEEAPMLQRALGDALKNTGRAVESAEAYLAAAEAAAGLEALELTRAAAEQLLLCGHRDRGLALLTEVLTALGVDVPKSMVGTVRGFFALRPRVRWRELTLKANDGRALSDEERARMDACWTAATGLVWTDGALAVYFNTRHYALALKSGDRYRVARSMATEALLTSGWRGHKARKRTERVLARSEQLTEQSGHAHARGMLAIARGMTAWHEGRWRECIERVDDAARTLRDECTGAWSEIDSTHVYALTCLYWLGDWAEVRRRWPALLASARQRGNLFAESNARLWGTALSALADGDGDEALAQVDTALAPFPAERFSDQRWYALWRRLEVDLCQGEPGRAMERVRAEWKVIEDNQLLRLAALRALFWQLRLRVAVAASDDVEVRRCRAQLTRERMPWVRALVAAADAITALKRDGDAGLSQLENAETLLTDAELGLHAACARRARGGILGGDEGAALIAEALEHMRASGVGDPDAVQRVLLPGLAAP
jgi:hypothetical protein